MTFQKITLIDSCGLTKPVLEQITVLSIVLGEQEFRSKKPNSILVNTSIGLTFDKDVFVRWISNDPTSFAIFDLPALGEFQEEFSKYPNVIVSDRSSGFTLEAQSRLSEKVLANIQDFL